jgi:hypothetical protein
VALGFLDKATQAAVIAPWQPLMALEVVVALVQLVQTDHLVLPEMAVQD